MSTNYSDTLKNPFCETDVVKCIESGDFYYCFLDNYPQSSSDPYQAGEHRRYADELNRKGAARVIEYYKREDAETGLTFKDGQILSWSRKFTGTRKSIQEALLKYPERCTDRRISSR